MMTSVDAVTGTVRSADGTTIAFERWGRGPALIFVNAAGCYRDFGSLRPLAELLAAHFTVFTYDRRGRGGSTDTLPYVVGREVDDLAAVIAAGGGSAFAYANSSGGLLVLQAAASGLPIRKLALFEPPIGSDEDAAADAEFTRELAELVAAGRRGDAAERFLTSIGVPPEMIAEMAPMRPALEAVAHTLVYDCILSNAISLETVSAVAAPTLIIDSQRSTGDLTGWAAAVVEALPNGTHRSLVGEWHGVPDEDLAAVLTEFFQGDVDKGGLYA